VVRSLIALAALAATLLFGRVALADATPVQLVLLYTPNVSNTGSDTASGVAELVMPEGEVRISAADLPRLDGDNHYVAWLINTKTDEFQRLGAFNSAQSTGAVSYENVLPDAIPNKQWNLLLITVENSAEPARPSDKHSIAGVFPSPDNQSLPIVLPNTGGDPDAVYVPVQHRPDWLPGVGLAALVASVTFAAGYLLGLKRA
jgi:hypothetical protein